jgi:hypothetical protein
LAALKPKHAVKLLCIGYACAAVMHGFWDAFVGYGMVLQLVLGVLFYALLIAGVLKARAISPTRAQNFATVLAGSPMVAATPVHAHPAVAAPVPRPQPPPPPVPQPRIQPPPVPVPRVDPPPVPQRHVEATPVPQPRVEAAPVAQEQPAPLRLPHLQPGLAMGPPAAARGLKLLIGLRTLSLHDGDRFQQNEIAGLDPASADGYVAAVNHNPNDPAVLGLQNLSRNAWRAVLPGGEVRDVPMGKSVKLASGSRIDFGNSQGEVQ